MRKSKRDEGANHEAVLGRNIQGRGKHIVMCEQQGNPECLDKMKEEENVANEARGPSKGKLRSSSQ